MIAARLQQTAEPTADFLVDAGGAMSYAMAAAAVEARARAWARMSGRRIGLRMAPRPAAFLDLLALDAVGARPYLFPPDLGDDMVHGLVDTLSLDGVLPDVPEGEGDEGPGDVVLFTSGTTGTPKAALHRWETLLSRVRPSKPGRWLLTYGGAAFAGLQVLMQAITSGSALVLASGGPAAMATLGAGAAADHVSGTPTFYRVMLATTSPDVLEGWHPVQITLGGEAIDQPILDGLRRAFPRARITHIYASTEMGVCFSVHDGLAGFPSSYLGSAATPVELAVDDGMLLIRSRHGMQRYLRGDARVRDDGFYPTGDLVEVDGDRVRFLGRHEERINVGGRKVHPRVVEQVLLEVDGVRAVRVSGAPSSVVGQIVKAEVVAAPGQDPAALKQRLAAYARSRLASYQVPRIVALVDELPLTASGKVVRT